MTAARRARSALVGCATVAFAAAALGACSTPKGPAPEASGYASVEPGQPGWVAGAPDLAATLLARAYAPTAPTTLRVGGRVERLHTPGRSPEQVVDDVTTGDYAEVLTDEARSQLAEVARDVRAVATYASVDVAPCAADGLEDTLPVEAWFDRAARELLVRTCVHVTGVGTDAQATVTESLEPVVVAAHAPSDPGTVGAGPISRIVLLDDLLWHDIDDSGLPWHEYVAQRL